MLREPYSDKSYTYWSKYIGNVLALRPPQKESLERFARIADTLSLSKTPDLAAELAAIRALFPTLTSFEREFPSVCFALATGIGKTRLMGALIAYLVYEKGIRNFFVMAPNLTIYQKLKADLGDPANPKYVFRGLDKFVTAPYIIDGGNYEEFRSHAMEAYRITINVFNISKLNSESGRMHRLQEVLGQSYFSYLQSLPDLCIFMDESHHYHADRGFDTINELRPILGVELTATPQIQKGAKKIDFQNVVYEYSLAAALNDGLYVKVPVVFTRRDFRPEEYTPAQLDHEKLHDGIRIHEETKSALEVYARNHDRPVVKPFVLVVAKDTEHSRQIREHLVSDGFFRGYYKDKVLEINSTQRSAEKDENIEQLLSLEQSENRIEIVLHVNMLKEGWDVTNLYTIIPLRASASETLTEQTIGRGLRLPYGARAGVDAVDRLSIVSHDRYQAIVALANDPNSLVRRVFFIEEEPQDDAGGNRETLELVPRYDSVTSAPALTDRLASALPQQTQERAVAIAGTVQRIAAETVIEVSKRVNSIQAVNEAGTRSFMHSHIVNATLLQHPDLKKEQVDAAVAAAIDACAQALTENVIPIPQAHIQPHTEVRHGFSPFHLDTSEMRWHPADDTLLGTELQEGGATFTLQTGSAAPAQADAIENKIARHVIAHDNIDYASCADLLYALIADAKRHFLSYLREEDAEKVMRERQRSISDIIYRQMNAHFYHEETSYRAAQMHPFSRIETSFGAKYKQDEIYDIRATLAGSEVKAKVFGGCKKAGHTLNKFDSDTERLFAIVLETDERVLRWLRPAPRQFNIYWGREGQKYEPDFIVETEDAIYMCEIKEKGKIHDDDVQQKAKAGREYCRAASEFNTENGGKPWGYVLIPHDEIHRNSGFAYLVSNFISPEQLHI